MRFNWKKNSSHTSYIPAEVNVIVPLILLIFLTLAESVHSQIEPIGPDPHLFNRRSSHNPGVDLLPDWSGVSLLDLNQFLFVIIFGITSCARRFQEIGKGRTNVNNRYKEKKEATCNSQTILLKTEFPENLIGNENIYRGDEIRIQYNFDHIIGGSTCLKKVLRYVEQVASTDATVLILGESGTGKELIAQAIHLVSDRRDRPMVKINCPAIPANLVESEFFGHEKGAFTGAISRKVGRFELADGGTIFLDEIGDLPIELQSKLLRVLQEGEFERLGNSHTQKVNVRVIAATNHDLEKAVAAGTFREDLFYRLNVFPITVPPLRSRKEDIPLLVKHFARKHCCKLNRNIQFINREDLVKLQNYNWPGNVRELENVIERAVILSTGKRLILDNWITDKNSSHTRLILPTLAENERNHIIKALEMTHRRISGDSGAAKILGINSKTLESRMKKLGIQRKTV